jgi:hypothetical protein
VRPQTLIIILASSAIALAAGFVLGGRYSIPAFVAPKHLPSPEVRSLPPIPPIGTALRRLDLTRKPSTAEVTAFVARVAQTGVFRPNKPWEIIINSQEAADLPALLEQIEKLPNGSARTRLRHAVFSRWAECDPSAAMVRAQAITDAPVREAAVESAPPSR